MRKPEKTMLIVAAVFIILGILVFVAAMSVNDWNFENLGTQSYEINTYSVTEDFRNISIDAGTADVQLLMSEDDSCKVVCFGSEKEKYHVSVENDLLTIGVVYEKKWYDYIEIMGKASKITLYLPKEQYEDLVIRENTGDIAIFDDFLFKNVDISLKTGDISLKNVLAETVELSLSTGDLDMRNVIVNDALFIKNSTGDVNFDACDADKITVRTTTGDVKGSFLSGKRFDVRTNTGDVEIPHGSIGGICEITTSTGDVEINILS